MTLAFIVKNLSGSRKLLEILNKFGHCTSYYVAEELETQLCYVADKQSLLIPPGVVKNNTSSIRVAYDNNDRYVDTVNGKHTLHDCIGVLVQKNIKKPNSTESGHIPNELSNSPSPSPSSNILDKTNNDSETTNSNNYPKLSLIRNEGLMQPKYNF